MAITFSCPRCGRELELPGGAAGGPGECPGCGAPMDGLEPVYEAEVAESPAAEPEVRRPCPMCGEMIVATAARCRFCGEIFDPALKKARPRGPRGRWRADEDLSGLDIGLAVIPFCTAIGCVVGLIYAIQGKPKGMKMLGLAIAMGVFWNLVGAMLRSVNQGGGP